MVTHRPFRIGLVQMACGPDPDANVDRAVDRVREAAGRGASVICLPELFRTQYFCQREDHALFDEAEPIPGPTTERFAALALELRATVFVPLFERRSAGVYHNTTVVLGPDGTLLGRYRKMHIPDDPLYYEKFYFAPGDLGFPTFPVPGGRAGVLICWDQWYPEAARLEALGGAELLFYPTRGRRSSAATRSRTGSTWRSRTASATSTGTCGATGRTDPASSSGGARSSRTRSAA